MVLRGLLAEKGVQIKEKEAATQGQTQAEAGQAERAGFHTWSTLKDRKKSNRLPVSAGRRGSLPCRPGRRPVLGPRGTDRWKHRPELGAPGRGWSVSAAACRVALWAAFWPLGCQLARESRAKSILEAANRQPRGKADSGQGSQHWPGGGMA